MGGGRLRPRAGRADRGRRQRAAYRRGAVHRGPGRRLRRRRRRRARPRRTGHARLQRRRPAVRDADLHRRPRGRGELPRHGDEPVGAAPGRALRAGRRQARRRAVRPGRRVGGGGSPGPARHRRRARPLRRVRALRRRRALRPHRRARHPRRRQPGHPRRRRQRGVRTRLLDVDDHRGVPQSARGVGEGEGRWRPGVGVLHAAALLRARGLRLPRGHRPGRVRARRARGGAPHAALGGRRPGDVQVRPGRGDDRHPAHAAHARPRLHRAGDGQGRPGLAARRGRGVPARPRDHRAADGGQDLRRAVRHRHRQGRCAAVDVPLPRGRQRRLDARLRRPVRGVADRDQPRRRPRAARRRHLVRHRRARTRGAASQAVPRPAGCAQARGIRIRMGPRGQDGRPT